MHVLIVPSERFVTEEEPLGGIFQRDQARALKRAGLKVGIIAPTPRSLRWLSVRPRGWPRGIEIKEEDGIPVYRCQMWRYIPGRVPYLGAVLPHVVGKRLFEMYTKDHGMPDLVHAHNSLYAGTIAVCLKQHYGIPFVLTEHSSIYLTNRLQGWQRPLVRNVLKNASVRIMVSKHLGRALERIFPEVASPWEWVPNILDPLFEYQNIKEVRVSDNRSTFRFLTVGALVPVKGHEVLLKAFAQVFRGNHRVQLRIGGDGPLFGKLQALTRKLGVQDQVKFLGRLNREQVLAEMQACDVFVLPSLYETFGVVLIEALSCGKPVIATACGGPEEIVTETNGILVPPGDEITLGRAMLQMVDSVNAYNAERIRRDCLALFGERAVVGRLVNIYKRVSLNGG